MAEEVINERKKELENSTQYNNDISNMINKANSSLTNLIKFYEKINSYVNTHNESAILHLTYDLVYFVKD